MNLRSHLCSLTTLNQVFHLPLSFPDLLLPQICSATPYCSMATRTARLRAKVIRSRRESHMSSQYRISYIFMSCNFSVFIFNFMLILFDFAIKIWVVLFHLSYGQYTIFVWVEDEAVEKIPRLIVMLICYRSS
jgi:hypothetical protein